MLAAWVRRNCRQLVSVCRTGAGGIRWRLRIRRIVEAPTRWPQREQLALDPLASPAGILRRHPYDQLRDRLVDRWPAGPVRVSPPRSHGRNAKLQLSVLL